MHESLPWVTIGIIVVTGLASLIGFRNQSFVERFIFCPEYILRDKQGYRLVTSAFLHANWQHLIFNMFSFYAFGRNLELWLGVTPLLAIYFASIIGGSLLSLFLHRHHFYKAYGASGGVCGIIYASIFLFPDSGIYILPLPFAIPAWIYAIAYLLFSFYGMKRAADNIGHDAHLGGAIVGLLTATALYPAIVAESPRLYAAVMVLSLGMFVFLLKNPLFLPSRSNSSGRPGVRRATSSPERKQEPADINTILEKISRSGIQSLTEAEHQALVNASQKNRRNDATE